MTFAAERVPRCCPIADDLVPFFRKRGFNIEAATSKKIATLKLPPLKTDPATIFKQDK